MLNICVVALFLAVSFAGCLESDKDDTISPKDVVVSPITIVGGEFQPPPKSPFVVLLKFVFFAFLLSFYEALCEIKCCLPNKDLKRKTYFLQNASFGS